MSPSAFYVHVFQVLGVISIIIAIWACWEENGYIFLLAFAVFGLAIADVYYMCGDNDKLMNLVMKEYEWTIDKLEKERESCSKYYDEDYCIIKLKHLKADSLYYKKILKGESQGVY